jgi:hypothetical protein
MDYSRVDNYQSALAFKIELEQRVVTPEEYVQRLVEKQFSWGDDD